MTQTRSTHLLKPAITHPYPTVRAGQGVYLTDNHGRRYLDGCSGAICANLGHGHPNVLRAIRKQAEELAFSYRTQFTNEPAEHLADELTRLAPDGIEWAFFVNSGSEATEAAMRLVLQYWRERGEPQRTKIVSRHISYHGVTLGALSMSGHDGRRASYETLLHKHAVVPPAYCYRCPFGRTPWNCSMECAAAWDQALEELDPQTVAAVIAEPIVGAAGGAIDPPPGYFRRLRDTCDRHGILVIADEVMTGLGRTGTWFESEAQGMKPDVIVVGKGMSAGYTPMAGVLLHDHIVQTLRTGSGNGGFGHTYSANPLSAATCLAVLRELRDGDLLAACRARGRQLEVGLRELQQRHPVIGDVRGKGLLLGIELVADVHTREPFPQEDDVSGRLVALAFERGLMVYPAGFKPWNNAILVAPPLTITEHETVELLGLLDDALSALEQQYGLTTQ